MAELSNQQEPTEKEKKAMSEDKDTLQKATLVAASAVAMLAAITLGTLQWKKGNGEWKDQYAYGTWKSNVDAGPMNLCRIGTVRASQATWDSLSMVKKEKKVKKKDLDGGVTVPASGLMLGKICFYQNPKCFDGGTWFGDAGYVDTGTVCSPSPSDAGGYLDAQTCTPGPVVENPRTDLCDPPKVDMPPGMEITKGDEFIRPIIDAEVPYEFWQIENPTNIGRCACAGEEQDAGCEKLIDGSWVAAVPGQDMSLRPGQWRGAGCFAQGCGNWGENAISAECCISECVGRKSGTGRCGTVCGTCPAGQMPLGYDCVPVPGPDAGPDAGPDTGSGDAQ